MAIRKAIIEARRRAARVDRLADRGVSATRAIAVAMRADAIAAFLRGREVNTIIREGMTRLAPILAEGMLLAHLEGEDSGIREGVELALPVPAGVALAADPYREALQVMIERRKANPYKRRLLAAKYGQEAVSATGRLTGKLEDSVLKSIETSLKKGEHVEQGIARLRKAFDNAGVSPGNNYALETMYRTQLQLANSAGRWRANQDPAIQSVLWGYEYVSAGDNRVRPTHDALDGTKLEKDDPRWRDIFPPNGYNCRCQAIEIWKDDPAAKEKAPPDRVKVDGVYVTPGPDDGFDFNPGEVFGR